MWKAYPGPVPMNPSSKDTWEYVLPSVLPISESQICTAKKKQPCRNVKINSLFKGDYVSYFFQLLSKLNSLCAVSQH